MAIVDKLRGAAGSCGDIAGTRGVPLSCRQSDDHRLPQSTANCHRLPQMIAACRRLPQITTNCRSSPQLPAAPRSLTAAPRSSPQMSNPLQMESQDENWWKYRLRNAYCPPANIASRCLALFKAKLQPLVQISTPGVSRSMLHIGPLIPNRRAYGSDSSQ